jgi:uncharacterized protein (DUF2141 family)
LEGAEVLISRAALRRLLMIRIARTGSLAFALTSLALITQASSTSLAEGGHVQLHINGLRNERGEIRAAIFASADGWTERGREVATCRATIHEGRATCVFRDIAPGEYAIAFLHDEDGNGDLARNFIGIPEEGFGFSNDARPGLGAPSFRDASITHSGTNTSLHAHVRYGL